MDIKQLDGLEKQIQNVENEIDVLQKSWAEEVANLSKKPNFDPYSKKGQKILNQVAEKYVDLVSDAEDRHDELVDEYNKIIKELIAAEEASKQQNQ